MQAKPQLLPLLLSVLAASICIGLAVYLARGALPGIVRLSSVPGAATTIGFVCSLIGAWVAISAGQKSWRRARDRENDPGR
jgi:membrane protein implicated in regulation of membrane protease activity